MDEAFRHLRETIVALVDQSPVVGHGPFAQRVSMTAIEIEMPLYLLKTSVLPSFHQMRVRASLRPDPGDGANDAE